MPPSEANFHHLCPGSLLCPPNWPPCFCPYPTRHHSLHSSQNSPVKHVSHVTSLFKILKSLLSWKLLTVNSMGTSYPSPCPQTLFISLEPPQPLLVPRTYAPLTWHESPDFCVHAVPPSPGLLKCYPVALLDPTITATPSLLPFPALFSLQSTSTHLTYHVFYLVFAHCLSLHLFKCQLQESRDGFQLYSLLIPKPRTLHGGKLRMN